MTKKDEIPTDNDDVIDDEEFSNEFDEVPTVDTDEDIDEDEMWVDENEE